MGQCHSDKTKFVQKDQARVIASNIRESNSDVWSEHFSVVLDPIAQEK